MKNQHFLFLLLIAFSLTSCFAIHAGMMSSSTGLNQANFSYVKKNVQGQATTKHIMGIGGLAMNAIVDSAKEDLLNANPLKENQALVNVVVDIKSSFTYLGIVRTYTCFVSADVVEFKK